MFHIQKQGEITRFELRPFATQICMFHIQKRVMGIEPTYPAWKAGVLPLNYTRRLFMRYELKVGVTGFEPATSWSQTRRSSQAEPHPAGFVLLHIYATQDTL